MSKAPWPRVALGDVVCLVKDRVADNAFGTLTHYVPGSGITDAGLRIVDWQPLHDGVMGPAFHMRFLAGHTLYKSRVPHGVAVADRPGICANTTFVLAPTDDRLLQGLLPFVLLTDGFKAFETKNNHGSTNLFLNFSDLAKYEFLLPPAAEQARLVRLLTSLFDLAEQYADLVSKLRDVREALLQTGRSLHYRCLRGTRAHNEERVTRPHRSNRYASDYSRRSRCP